MSWLTIEPLGDRAFLLQFTSEASAAAWAESLRQAARPGVIDIVLAYRSVAVFVDPDLCDPARVESWLRAFKPEEASRRRGRLIVIPVLYDGPDLDSVAAHVGMDAASVVEEHGGVDYEVFAVGFLPGFPYAGYLPSSLSGIPRRTDPRVSVPAGSVAIAGKQTGIYPIESPGGWHLLGRTPLCIADPESGYFPIRSGDRLRFQTIGACEFNTRLDERL